ncbi:MAG: shikimate kinase [Bacillota bacterium]|nr:shikimate kinase [Bacillota bacterium]
MRIAFIGMMLCGKSSVAAALADHLGGYRLLETDAMIERIAGLSVSDIFEKKGEQVFRDLESRIFEQIASQNHIVVACGGGLPMQEANRRLLGTFDYVFFLRASLPELLARLDAQERAARPLLHNAPEETLKWLLEVRTPIYTEICTHIIDADRSIPEIVSAVVHILLREHEQPKHS